MGKTEDLLYELDDVISKLKMKILYYQTENSQLRSRIKELNIVLSPVFFEYNFWLLFSFPSYYYII